MFVKCHLKLHIDITLLKKVSGTYLEITRIFDQAENGEHEYGQKTGTGSSFCRHFGEKPRIKVFWV